MRTATIVFLIVLAWTTAVPAGPPVEGMVALELHGERIEGMPLAWGADAVHLLGRDGRLWSFDPDEATSFRKTSNRFRSYSVSELRATLLRELGKAFEVTGTSHYLVAHPRGQRDRWAERFEQLYRSFVHYFAVRGFRLQEPPFPLVGIVCRDQRDFIRYSARDGLPVGRGVLGYYSLESNRIILFDMTGGETDSADWRQNASVVIHEATHQMAFNTGIHSRYSPPPLWVAEGVATLFEAPGVHNSRYHTRRSDRINRGRFEQFRRLVVPHHKSHLPAELTASDRLFRTHTAAAYAEAWAMTFYLVETQPAKYFDYLLRTAAHPPFAEYTAAERTADFTAVFGKDWRMFEARFLRFMAIVK